MAAIADIKPGASVRVTILKTPNRAGAAKTLERLFLTDKAVSKPIADRTKNFEEKPKRRGGRIWTKRPNRPDFALPKGRSATIKATAQYLKDLKSVESFVTVEPA